MEKSAVRKMKTLRMGAESNDADQDGKRFGQSPNHPAQPASIPAKRVIVA